MALDVPDVTGLALSAGGVAEAAQRMLLAMPCSECSSASSRARAGRSDRLRTIHG